MICEIMLLEQYHWGGIKFIHDKTQMSADDLHRIDVTILIVKDGRAGIDIVNRLSDISCSAKIYRAEYPIATEGRSLAAN
jgi:hypothetical protein